MIDKTEFCSYTVSGGVIDLPDYQEINIFSAGLHQFNVMQFVLVLDDRYVLFPNTRRDDINITFRMDVDCVVLQTRNNLQTSRDNTMSHVNAFLLNTGRSKELFNTRKGSIFEWRLHHITNVSAVESLKNYKELSEKEQLRFVLSHRSIIKFIENPSKSIIMAHSLKFKL